MLKSEEVWRMSNESVYLPGKIRDRIQDLMKSNKVTQAELATRIGCSESIHHALYMIEDREEQYLRYRYGFDDDVEHPLTETAKHFHLSESRAKKTEALALDNVWLELPWWY